MARCHQTTNNHLSQIEQLECLRSENTTRCPMITHTIDSYQIPSQNKTNSKLHILKNCQKFKFWNFANKKTQLIIRHTFWSCLIKCVNMKWIRLVMWKLESWHDSDHRRTDIFGEFDLSCHEASCTAYLLLLSCLLHIGWFVYVDNSSYPWYIWLLSKLFL